MSFEKKKAILNNRKQFVDIWLMVSPRILECLGVLLGEDTCMKIS